MRQIIKGSDPFARGSGCFRVSDAKLSGHDDRIVGTRAADPSTRIHVTNGPVEENKT